MTTTIKTPSRKISPWIGILLIVGSNLPLLKLMGFEMNPWMNVFSLALTGSGIIILFKGMGQLSSQNGNR